MNKSFVQTEMANEIRFNQLEKLKYFPKMDRMIVCDHSKTVKLYKPVVCVTIVLEILSHHCSQ
jgi:hypothetical protein